MKVMYDTFINSPLDRSLQSKNKLRLLPKSRRARPIEVGAEAPSTGSTQKSGSANRRIRNAARVLALMLEKQVLQQHGEAGFTAHLSLLLQHGRRIKRHKLERSPREAAEPATSVRSTGLDDQAIRKLVEQEVVRVLSTMAQPESQALRSARERGLAYARSEYEKPEHLSLPHAAAKAKLSERIINERRNAGRYYALIMEGNTRGYRFPEWQFGVKEERLTPVLDVLRAAQASCWMMHHFLIAPNTLLGNVSPRDYLLAPDQPLEHLLNIVRGRFASDQGAG
jgi:hypothetical protein